MTDEIVVSSGPLVSARFQLDGSALFVASRADRAVRKYDLKSLRMIQASAQSHTVSALSIGPTGRYWAAGDTHGEVRIWDLRNPHPKSVLIDPSIRSVFANADQIDEFLLGGNDSSQHWSATEKTLRPFHYAKGLRAISQDATTMVCTSGVGDSGSQIVEVWRQGASEPQRIQLQDSIFEQCLAISTSGRWLATRTAGEPIQVYDLQASPPMTVHDLVANCYHFSFSPDERLLVGGEQYGSVCCFDVTTGKKLTNFAEFDSLWAWGMSVAFSADNQYVASGNESGTVRVWETESRNSVAALLGQPGEIRSIAFFPDGRRLAVGGTGDVRIWDFQTGQELLALPVSGERVLSLAVGTTGETLAAVTSDGHVHIWTGKTSPRKSSTTIQGAD
jgi:WD40 repeat protein